MDSGSCGRCSRACLCGSVQNQAMPAGLKLPATMPDRNRSERKGADHGETDQKRGTPQDAWP